MHHIRFYIRLLLVHIHLRCRMSVVWSGTMHVLSIQFMLNVLLMPHNGNVLRPTGTNPFSHQPSPFARAECRYELCMPRDLTFCLTREIIHTHVINKWMKWTQHRIRLAYAKREGRSRRGEAKIYFLLQNTRMHSIYEWEIKAQHMKGCILPTNFISGPATSTATEQHHHTCNMHRHK